MSAAARRNLWVSVLFLLLVVAGLISQWPSRSLWYDETVNAYFARRGWSAIWNWCTRIDNQVPLHFVLLKLWGSAVGTGEFALRAFSFWCAVLSVAGLIALGRQTGGRASAGWLAAAAFVLSQGFLYAAFEVRAYALALVLFAWSSVILWKLWRRYESEQQPLDRHYTQLLALYLLLAWGLIYTHYTGFLALAVQGTYLGWQTLLRFSRRRIVLLGHTLIGAVIGYLPWVLALAGRDVRAGTAYAGRIHPDVALKAYADFYVYGQKVVPPHAPPYTTCILVLLASMPLFWLLLCRKQWSGGLIFALIAVVLPVAALTIMVYGVQAKLSGRHGWPMWLGASLLIGSGLAALGRFRWIRWPLWGAALLVVWLPASEHFKPFYDSQFREAFAYIKSHAEPGDVLVLRDGTLFTAAGYYRSAIPWIGLPPDQVTNVNHFTFFPEAYTSLDELISRNQAHRVWVIAWQGHIMDPQDLIAGMLEYVGDPQPIERPFGDVFVSLYVLHDPLSVLYDRVNSMKQIAQAPPQGPIFLGGYVVDQTPVPQGGIVRVHTWWERGEAIMPDMRISIRLYGPDGTLYSQLDQPPVNWSFKQTFWRPGVPILSRFMLWVPYDVPGGPVEVRVILYKMQDTFEPITVPVGTFEVSG